MKRKFIIFFLILFIGVGVIFTGCNTTDLSSLNAQIAEMQQDISDMQNQIDDLKKQNSDKQNQINDLEEENATIVEKLMSLNQTITDLQSRLNDAEGDVSSLQSQLAISIANYNELYTRVYGESNAYLELTETFCYSTNGLKLFDLSIVSAEFNQSTTAHSVTYSFNSYVSGVNSIDDARLSLTFLLYEHSSNQTYEVSQVTSSGIRFNLSTPDEARTGLLYVYVGNVIGCIYNISFDEISS